MSTPSKCVISRRNRRVKATGPYAPSAMALDTSCLPPRPPRCVPCSRTKTSGRRLTTLNVLSLYSSALRQSCGQLPRLLGQRCLLSDVPSHASARCASPASTTVVPPAAEVVVATLTIFAATPTVAIPAVTTVAASLFPPASFGQLVLQGSAKRQGRGPRRGLSAGP